MAKPPRIERASQRRLDKVRHLAPRFFQEVVGWDFAEVLVTDESDLRDFADITQDRKTQVDGMLDRMTVHYGVDARAARSTMIVDLLELLASRGVTR